MDYLGNIEGCLLKYWDFSGVENWLQKASKDLSSEHFKELITQIHGFLISDKGDLYSEDVYRILVSYDPKLVAGLLLSDRGQIFADEFYDLLSKTRPIYAEKFRSAELDLLESLLREENFRREENLRRIRCHIETLLAAYRFEEADLVYQQHDCCWSETDYHCMRRKYESDEMFDIFFPEEIQEKQRLDAANQLESMTVSNLPIPPPTLYHFTDPRNLPSIKEKGLLSWPQLNLQHINHFPASNQLSRNLDTKKGLQNYVRLCLQRSHRMATFAKHNGRIQDIVWLTVNVEVARSNSTLYSDRNATKNGARIDSDPRTAFNSNDSQAEVLINGEIASKWITFPE